MAVKDLLIMMAATQATVPGGTWTQKLDYTGSGRMAVWQPSTQRAYLGGDTGIVYTTNQASTITNPAVGITTSVWGNIIGSYVFASARQIKSAYYSLTGSSYTTTSYTVPNAYLERSVGGVTNGLMYSADSPRNAMVRVTPSTNTITDITADFKAAMPLSTTDCHGAYLPQQAVSIIGGQNGNYVISTDDNLTFTMLTMSLPGVVGSMNAVVETSAGRCIACVGETIYYSDDVTNPNSWVLAYDATNVTTVLWGNGNIIASSTNSDLTILGSQQTGADGFLFSKDNGVTWNLDTAFLVASTNYINQVCYAGNNTFLAVTNLNEVYAGAY
ncbi:MAG: hypothetical protein ACO22S_04715 [Burkholderiaceae bacterium]